MATLQSPIFEVGPCAGDEESFFSNSNSHRFCECDPYTPWMELSGRICQTGGHGGDMYGALEIDKIEDKKTGAVVEYEDPLYIQCTPKLKYPFDKDGALLFPKRGDFPTERYRKYDGTNIYMFLYPNPNEESVHIMSFKTRRVPFIRPEFKEMWDKMLEKYPGIIRLFGKNTNFQGFSFEMYGVLNKHTILYKETLDAVLLFARDENSQIVPPSLVRTPDVPKASYFGDIGNVSGFMVDHGDHEKEYRMVQSRIEEKLLHTDDGIEGEEGEVWFYSLPDRIQMYKLKPPTIQKLHWSNNKIPKASIRTTVQNAFEESSVVDLALIRELLKEDYEDVAIDNATKRINSVISEVIFTRERHEKIKVLLEGMDYVSMEMPDIMRSIHHNFEKSQMRRVYGYVKAIKDNEIERMNSLLEQSADRIKEIR